MNIRSALHKAILNVPYFGKKIRQLESCGYEPGHYYSTIPDLKEVQKRRSEIFSKRLLRGIDLNREKQFDLLKEFEKYYKDLPYNFDNQAPGKTRYQVKDAWYRYSDTIMLYSMIRFLKPSRIIEIGSGYSSAIMLDTNDLFFNSSIKLTFIDPYTERLYSLFNDDDRKKQEVLQNAVQDVSLDIFRGLEKNDILFVDSSHVSKVGSDLNHILFEILPVLNSDVYIHFHDIHYPFELPEHWVFRKKWFWNENYLIRAFLTGNPHYEIVNFNTYLHHEFPEWFRENMPSCLTGSEDVGSIWIHKK
jgi:predicted O-methyltransferase YrrM